MKHIDPETEARIKKIFEGDEHDRLGREWYARGSRLIDGVLIPSEPAHGARVNCLWNSDTKRWKPECTPPEIIPQAALSESDLEK